MERDFAQRTRYTLLDEAKEIVILPKFREHSCHDGGKELDPVIVEQLNTFVKNIAGMYHENLFHNFEHASHVAMSTVKLLSRIVAPSRTTTYGVDDEDTQDTAATLHDHTYGITSDPLTQFSCVLSALIHDVDHVGVPNAQLVQEGSDTSKKYNGRSVAE